MSAHFPAVWRNAAIAVPLARAFAICVGFFSMSQVYAQGVDDAVGVPVRIYWKGVYNAYPLSPPSGTLKVNLPFDGLTEAINAEMNIPQARVARPASP